ncbi:hypothetical protein [Xanthobacter versatilis]|uniref:hypothetical protein n=1 Tax=Xanthobacter autotrophicus (strain ATCC BAA-1158 / Py2) TaxID=78245 RepID=UPI00372C0432
MELWYDKGEWFCLTPKHTYRLTAEKAEGFVSANMREPALAGLVSPLLALQIMCLFLEEGEPPRAFAKPMLDVVAALSAPDGVGAPDRASWEKAHTPLNRPKLRPLCILHKHVSLAKHMLANAALAVSPAKPKDTEALHRAVAESLDSALAATGGDLDAAAEAGAAALMRPVDRRIAQRRQTGDWIIFEVVDGRPYFLCLFPHPEPDEECDDEIAVRVKLVRDGWHRRAP